MVGGSVILVVTAAVTVLVGWLRDVPSLIFVSLASSAVAFVLLIVSMLRERRRAPALSAAAPEIGVMTPLSPAPAPEPELLDSLGETASEEPQEEEEALVKPTAVAASSRPRASRPKAPARAVTKAPAKATATKAKATAKPATTKPKTAAKAAASKSKAIAKPAAAKAKTPAKPPAKPKAAVKAATAKPKTSAKPKNSAKRSAKPK